MIEKIDRYELLYQSSETIVKNGRKMSEKLHPVIYDRKKHRTILSIDTGNSEADDYIVNELIRILNYEVVI